MALHSAVIGAPADPLHQQGMSPSSTPLLEGETRGPSYGPHPAEPLHDLQHEAGQQGAPINLPNGVAATVVPGTTLSAEMIPTVQNAAVAQGDRDPGPRQIPLNRGTVVNDPSGTREETGFVPPAMNVTGSGRDDVALGAPLFPRFMPSPLPGQSPVSAQGTTPTRATAWLSKIGEYLQRTVEVTAWTSHGAASGSQVGQWPVQETAYGMPAPSTTPRASMAAVENRAPSSTGSAGITPELVQAEVAKQLEAAMGDLNERLQMERRRAEEATLEAQRLRHQLEASEAASLTRLLPPGDLQPPPGLLERDGYGGPGVYTGVTTGHTPLVPDGSSAPLPVLDALPLLDPQSRARNDGMQERDLLGASAGLGDVYSGAGVSGVTASHTPSGPNISLQGVRPRSQSPGPRAFFQGLFGRGSTGRTDKPNDEARPVGTGATGPQLLGSTLPTGSVSAGGVQGPTSSTTPEGNLLATLARSIETLLQQQQQGGKSDRPETVKPGITDLPSLPEYQPTTGSIDLLNWLTHIQPIMQDLSDTSYAWWEATLQDALTWYTQYSAASPLEGLQLKPTSSQALSRPEWARVERRATAMMLSAVPQPVREEVIAMGSVTSLALLCKLYAVYQPGNLQEKALVLQKLERPDACETALQAVEALRKWSLWRRRAASIGIAEPDASVLIQGLDRITTKVVKANSELSFRVSLIRSTLQVDVCPSSQSVTTFLQHLQAEMEQQARLGATNAAGAGDKALRALGASDAAASATSTPSSPTTSGAQKLITGLCRFFQGEKGCRRGNTCRYPHTWSLLEKGARSKKCLACGSTAHKVKDCKAPGGALAKTARAMGSGPGETGSTSPTNSAPEVGQRKVNFEDEVIQTKVLKLLAEVQGIPLFRSVTERIQGWRDGFFSITKARPALLDSGATHVLRAPHNEEEWNEAADVSVKLAGDATATMRQTSTGSLLSSDQLAQVIVPLGKVIATLGYELNWTSRSCELVGPDGEVLPLVVKNGCPEIGQKAAARLIQQLEEEQVAQLEDATQASQRALRTLKASWWSYLQEYVRTHDLVEACAAVDKAFFLDYKDDVKRLMVTKTPRNSIWEMLKNLCVNRRGRKKLMKAHSWVLRWDPPTVDRPRDALKHLSYIGNMVYVNMSILLIENEFEDVWRVVQWAALTGRISTMVARDGTGTPLDKVVAGPHRSKFHFLHALASASRELLGGGVVTLYVEDCPRVKKFEEDHGDGMSSMWPPWTLCKDAQQHFEEMGLMNVSVTRFEGDRTARLAKLNSDAEWRLHVARNHQPFRRDCSVCVRNSATGHQHRSSLHPMVYSLSVDVVGPLKGYGRSPDGKFFRYFVIGALRIPKVDGACGHGEVRGYPLPPPPVEEDEEIEIDDEKGEGDVDGPGRAGVSPEEIEEEERRWKELLATFKEPIATTTLYFVVPVNNKRAATMLPAVQKIVMDVKALGYPVTRLHSDRGGEFRGNLVRKWALGQGMWPTTTSGSDSAANGVAESGVRFIKRRARVLLDTAGIARENWPTAVQYAAAQQRADQLGVLPPMPVAYGTKVYVKTKRYKTGAVEDFGPHWTRGQYVGPSSDIRGGHVILKDTGTFIQTTHVRVTRDPPPLEEVAPTVRVEPELSDGELEPPLPPPVPPPPPRRVRLKAPGVSRLDGCFLETEVLFDVASPIVFDNEDSQVKYLRMGEIQYVEGVAERMCNDNKFDSKHCARLLALFAGTCGNLKVPRAPKGEGMILGAYVHAGSFGITRYGRDLPWVTRYFNNYLKKKLRKSHPTLGCSWTTIALQSADSVPIHKDSHNEPATYNYVMEIKTDAVEGLWVKGNGDERQVQGGSDPRDYQYEKNDGTLHDGCLVKVTTQPAVFDPHVPHAYVNEERPKWFLSAYTPQGAYKLNVIEKKYLESLHFPLAKDEEGDLHVSGASETRPVLKACSLPAELPLSGAQCDEAEVEVATVGDCEATLWEWGMYVEVPVEEEILTAGQANALCLKKVCSSDDPRRELNNLPVIPAAVGEEEVNLMHHQDLEENVEYWSSLGLYDGPKLAKLEPEYVVGVEEIITKAVETENPLRHTYNVSPHEAKAAIDRWKPAIAKELGVVERGFKRVSVKDLAAIKAERVVQELPSKLVYTVKPPAEGTVDENEAKYCKRKARIVCCGNYASKDPGELFAGGAAAESLRCALTYTARRKWRSGITDITGAFMLTPLPTGPDQVIYSIRPPAVVGATWLGFGGRAMVAYAWNVRTAPKSKIVVWLSATAR